MADVTFEFVCVRWILGTDLRRAVRITNPDYSADFDGSDVRPGETPFVRDDAQGDVRGSTRRLSVFLRDTPWLQREARFVDVAADSSKAISDWLGDAPRAAYPFEMRERLVASRVTLPAYLGELTRRLAHSGVRRWQEALPLSRLPAQPLADFPQVGFLVRTYRPGLRGLGEADVDINSDLDEGFNEALLRSDVGVRTSSGPRLPATPIRITTTS